MMTGRVLQWLKEYYRYAELLLCALMTFLYGYVALGSYGYDDEYYNIRLVRELNLGTLISTIQDTDVHPPLSYILNYFFYSVMHSWPAVRLVSPILFLTALFYLLWHTKTRKARLLILLFLGLNPSVLLWTTGIRWYAYVIPLLVCLQVLPDYRKSYYWWRFFIICLVICFLGYIGTVLTVAYFLMYWLNDKHNRRSKIRRVLLPGLLFVLAYAYQFRIFLTVHAKNDLPGNQQTFDLLTSFLSYLSSAFSNQGLFPVSLFGIISMAGMGLVMLYALVHWKMVLRENRPFAVFAILSVCFIFTGIAGKIRNLFLLEPSRIAFLSGLSIGKYKPLLIAGFLFLLAGNGKGIYHVITHQQTSKNAWNIDMPKTLAWLYRTERTGAHTVYFTHHPSFAYHFTTGGKQAVSFYNSLYFDSGFIKTTVAKLAAHRDTAPYDFTFVINYRGKSIPEAHYRHLLSSMGAVKADSVKQFYMDRDPGFRQKRIFFHDYPEYLTSVVKYYGVKDNFQLLNAWERNK